MERFQANQLNLVRLYYKVGALKTIKCNFFDIKRTNCTLNVFIYFIYWMILVLNLCRVLTSGIKYIVKKTN